jgi:DNA-binding beta-propeller fold protein YncE
MGFLLALATAGLLWVSCESPASSESLGTLRVNSSPPSALVYIDGRYINRLTNCILTDIEPGERTVSVRKEGYLDYSTAVTVVAGQAVTIDAVLAMHTFLFTSPGADTSWRPRMTMEVRWLTDPAAAASLNADMASLGSDSLHALFVGQLKFKLMRDLYALKVIAWLEENTGSFIWTVPEGYAAAADYYINIAVANDGQIHARSPSFMISSEIYAFSSQWGGEGSGDGRVSAPAGIAADGSGSVYVADTDNDRIQKFTAEGVFLSAWGTTGTAPGEFRRPAAVAVDNEGRVFVADTENDRVQAFTAAGDLVDVWGESGAGQGQFARPKGISAGPGGIIYVADTGNDRIQAFSPTGSFLAAWGSRGNRDGQMDGPEALAAGADGHVYVADTYNDRIQRFTGTGAFVTSWTKAGGINLFLSRPKGVATDLSGNVYVTDTGNGRVSKFTSDGAFVTRWGDTGGEAGQFDSPQGLTVDALGRVFVTDPGNDRIQCFAIARSE